MGSIPNANNFQWQDLNAARPEATTQSLADLFNTIMGDVMRGRGGALNALQPIMQGLGQWESMLPGIQRQNLAGRASVSALNSPYMFGNYNAFQGF